MFQELKLFNGGVNNIAAPHLIQANQGIYVSNSNIENGELSSAKVPKATGNELVGQSVIYYKAQDKVVASAEDRFYVEWAGFLYWSNAAGSLKRYDGTTVLDIGGHTAPSSAPTLATEVGGLLDGSYTYAITYTHSSVFESPPSAFVDITAAKNKVTVTFADTTPPASATHRNIYRAGGLNPTFNLVAKIPIATGSYSDNIADFDVSRTELKTNNTDPAPANIDMLIEVQGTLFGAVGNKVHFSKEGQPEYWSDYNLITLPKTVTGLGVFGTSVIAFTDSEMYMISGSNINNIAVTKMPFNYGCKNKRTVKNIEGRLMWVSSLDEMDAICVFDGSGVTVANKIDKNINAAIIGSLNYDNFGDDTYTSFDFAIKNAIVSNHKYYLFMTGRTAVLDFETDLKIYYMTESVDAAYSKNNNLFVSMAGLEYEYFPAFSTYRNISYRTGDIDNGSATLIKSYRYIKVNGTGTYKIHVFVDDVNIMQLETEKDFMPHGTRGKMISFLIESNGYAKIKSISYEYDHMKE